ncbi:PspC domain-containing protein [Pseudohongiella spirulinae]|uniref:Phage shock protein PspC N-terminal domain-containing protein n=1 Tax=Pseudohongiella spirulinae TaxID=1249552 RepID=A0A0S2KCH8_9GAMM|nr:PspC domain-containing protein [Pseudohongiella spirulinae]ALO45893.1 hypothetical protein PS2015_1234 [Pseudohongiella spirulinae]
MSNPNERPKLRLDRQNRKLLGVCGGFANYLDVPAALVRVIYCIACLVSPVLLIVYFVLYWLLEDEDRPARIKDAINGKRREDTAQASPFASEETDNVASANQTREPGRFDIRRPLHRSRRNVRVAGVCAGVANYLGVSTFLVRLITLLSLFILGGITIWGYVILWIVLDKEPKVSKKGSQAAAGPSGAHDTFAEASVEQNIEDCAQKLRTTATRLQEVEAFITSKQFRLHCEINRI